MSPINENTNGGAMQEIAGENEIPETAAAGRAKEKNELDAEAIRMKSWKYIVEKNSASDERLDRVALISMDRTYTYRQMFRAWEKYAEVFSALNITAENHSRMAVFDCTSVESSFAIYAANMTGASVAGLPPYTISDKYPLEKVIETEKITDLFINDLVVNSKLLVSILRKKTKLGLRNIIVARVSLENENMEPELIRLSNSNYAQLKRVQGALFMDDLLNEYEATTIKYGPDVFEKDAFILHTSGTTKGISKPAPLSDIALNAAAESLIRSGKAKQFENGAVSMCFMVATSVYGLADQLHAPLAFGCSVLIPPMATSNPFALKAIEHYKVNILFITPFYFEIWAKMPPECLPDFSSVKLIVFGGSYLSAEARKRYDEIVKARGGNAAFINGYGMSETGGACIIQTDEVEDDSIGLPLPGVKIRIFDENEKKFYSVEDKHTGVLYISSDSISEGKIGDESFFEPEMIDGVPYICTNDVVGVNKDGSLRWQGRANRFFVNNEGIRFNAGLVESQVAAEPGIEACAVVPWFDKIMTHDTVPVLYVQTAADRGKEPAAIVKDALMNVFINNGKAEETNLPVQCVMVDQIPHNANGKVDIYKITGGGVTGARYVIRPVKWNGALKDVLLEYDADESNSVGNGAIPDELSQIVESVKSTTADDTVLNAAGRIANSKIMLEVFAKGQQRLYQQPVEMMMQFFNMAQAMGMQIMNSLTQMMNYISMQQMQLMQNMPQMQYAPQQAGTQAQMPQMPYILQQAGTQAQMPQMPYILQQTGAQPQMMQMPQVSYMPQQTGAQPQMVQMPQVPYMPQQAGAQPQTMQMPQVPYMPLFTPPVNP